jgi:hypothetical protein
LANSFGENTIYTGYSNIAKIFVNPNNNFNISKQLIWLAKKFGGDRQALESK